MNLTSLLVYFMETSKTQYWYLKKLRFKEKDTYLLVFGRDSKMDSACCVCCPISKHGAKTK